MLDFVYKNVAGALLGGGKPSHPLANIKQAKKLISEFPPYNAVKALEEVTFWLASVSGAPEFTLGYRFELLDLLDQAGTSSQRKVRQEYHATNQQDKLRKNKLLAVVSEFWKTLGTAYVQCVEQFQSGAVAPPAIKKQMPVIVARAVRALTLRLKWTFQQYGAVDDRIWDDLARLYLFAETHGFATAVTDIYPETHDQGTVQQEFLKAMMLAVSSTDSLTPLQQEVAERTVAHLSGMYRLHSKQELRAHHFFDLAVRKRPARTLTSIETNDMTRFFGAGTALLALAQLVQEIRTNNSTPSYLDPGTPVEADVTLSVMRHLALQWSDRPPTRRSERRQIATSLTVVHNYKQVMKNILPAAEDNSLDFQAQYASENWIIENINDGGYGAIIPPEKGAWIIVGNLLGLQTESSRFWGVGLVRRITSDQYQQRRVGIQLLSKAIIPVMVSPACTVSSMSAPDEGDSALLLSGTPDENGNIDLLLRKGCYTPGHALEMTVHGKRYNLLPSVLVEGGNDFDWAKCKVMQRQ